MPSSRSQSAVEAGARVAAPGSLIASGRTVTRAVDVPRAEEGRTCGGVLREGGPRRDGEGRAGGASPPGGGGACGGRRYRRKASGEADPGTVSPGTTGPPRTSG